jgi:hypothetical protein
MIDSMEHPPEGSGPVFVQERGVPAAMEPVEPENGSYEWHLIRCQKPLHSYLIEVGESMRAIRDGELFRAEYPSWADFCRQKLKISAHQADRRIQSAEIASELVAADCTHIPFNERQCRPLTRLEPGFLRVYAWELACSITPLGKAPTGNDVIRAVRLLESWRPPINEEKRPYFDVRKLLYESRIPLKLAQQISDSSSFQQWVNEQGTKIELNLLRNLVADLVARLNSLKFE